MLSVLASIILLGVGMSDAHIPLFGDLIRPVAELIAGDCTLYQTMLNSSSADLNELTLQLYDSDGMQELKFSADVLLASPRFNVSRKLVVYTHGFKSDVNTRGGVGIAQGFVMKGGYNVLALDTGNVLNTDYITAAFRAKEVGNALGGLLADLATKGPVSPEAMYLVGHSLGAHVSGFAGKYMVAQSRKIQRISGLDAAGPCFYTAPAAKRLDKADASFVDVMHTDAGGFGLSNSIGHIDFFPNGGSNQPGCFTPYCNHIRSWRLFVESIEKEKNFPAMNCTGYWEYKFKTCFGGISYMGYGASGGSGNYYLTTHGKPPYGDADPFYDQPFLQQVISRIDEIFKWFT